MQRAQQYLERAAHLEGTGQPALCATYVRRAGDLIEETRTLVAEHRGPNHATGLALQRAGQRIKDAFRPFVDFIRGVAEATQDDYVLGGPSKGGGS